MGTVPPPEGAGYFAAHTVAELAGELRAGRTSPTELATRALAEAARLDPALNAFVTLDADGAMAAARRAGEELAAGTDRGPLHGIPVAVKDVVDVAGLPTTLGSRAFPARVPDRDAGCVRRLRAAGSVVIGKAATHELAFGPTGDRAAGGATRNPYRPGHMSGGSSSGSAVAVAAGIVPLAVGTDTGGSIRIPAALCGVAGLRPTHGAVPVDGVFPVAESLDTVGPLARTAEDCRLLWQALVGTAVRAGPAARAGAAAPNRPDAVRVGWLAPESLHPADPAVVERARDRLAEGGLPVREVTVPSASELAGTYATLQGAEAYAVHAERLRTAADRYGAEVRARLEAAGRVPGWEYVRARAVRDRALRELFTGYDLLALPTVPIPAPELGARELRLDGRTVDVRAALLALTSPWSVLGLPALSVPAGLVDGRPVGLQLVAPPGAEDLLLTVAQRLPDTRH